MNRRTLIKTLGISAVGLATVPFWIDAWSPEDLPEGDGFLTGEQRLDLQAIIDSIIPTSNTPGAKDLEVEKFVSVMVRDCYTEEIENEFLVGFNDLNRASQEMYRDTFIKIEQPEREDVLCTLEAKGTSSGNKVNFVAFVKSLTIAGFMSSRFIMENHLNYEMVPSRFNGSFPVNNSIYSNA